MPKAPSVLLVLLAACDPQSPPVPDPPDTSGIEVVAFPAAPMPLDLLFVIDDSPSMADKQAALAASFPRLVEQLQSLDGGVPDLHLGVISTDMGVHASATLVPGTAIGSVGNGGCAENGDNGALLTIPNVLTEPDARFLVQTQNGATNFVGTLATAFGSLARLGNGGCGFEQPLAAIQASLTNPDNVGFIRPEASLAVIILSDEDDCSVKEPALFGPESAELGPLQSFRCFRFGTECAPDDVNTPGVKSNCRPRASSQLIDDVAPYRDLLLAAKDGDPRRVMIGAISGPTTRVEVELRSPPGGGAAQNSISHACQFDTSTGMAVADPAVRIASFVNEFSGRKALASVCSNDLAPAAIAVGKGLKRLVGDRCLERAIPEQMDCTVVDELDGHEPSEIFACGSNTTGPCFEIVDDATCSLGARLAITRETPAPAGTFIAMYCR
jgi:hypothetical protein